MYQCNCNIPTWQFTCSLNEETNMEGEEDNLVIRPEIRNKAMIKKTRKKEKPHTEVSQPKVTI